MQFDGNLQAILFYLNFWLSTLLGLAPLVIAFVAFRVYRMHLKHKKADVELEFRRRYDDLLNIRHEIKDLPLTDERVRNFYERRWRLNYDQFTAFRGGLLTLETYALWSIKLADDLHSQQKFGGLCFIETVPGFRLNEDTPLKQPAQLYFIIEFKHYVKAVYKNGLSYQYASNASIETEKDQYFREKYEAMGRIIKEFQG